MGMRALRFQDVVYFVDFGLNKSTIESHSSERIPQSKPLILQNSYCKTNTGYKTYG